SDGEAGLGIAAGLPHRRRSPPPLPRRGFGGTAGGGAARRNAGRGAARARGRNCAGLVSRRRKRHALRARPGREIAVTHCFAKVRNATAPSTIAPPAIDHGPGRSPVPSTTQRGLHTGSSIEIRLASAAGTRREPRANSQYETPSCITP